MYLSGPYCRGIVQLAAIESRDFLAAHHLATTEIVMRAHAVRPGGARTWGREQQRGRAFKPREAGAGRDEPFTQ